MRFLVDMGIGLDVARSLRSAGHDVVHLHEVGLQRLSDDLIIAKAAQEDRVILTHDLDFSRLLALSGANRPSIVTFRLSDMTPMRVLLGLNEVLKTCEAALKEGAAVVVSDRAIRCRLLPI